MVTATNGGGSPSGAGIGGDANNSAGNLIVTGGIVNATGYAGIGSCQYAVSMGTFTLNGNGLVFTNSVRTDIEGIKGILFIGNSGTVYGNVTLEENTTIPSSKKLTIPDSSFLLIPEEVTLTNNGIVTPSNGSTMTVFGLVSGEKIDGANIEILPIGDVDGSGTVNSVDFAYMRRHLLGMIKDFKPDDDLWVSDVNGDGIFDSIDFAFMRQFLLGKIDKFPK